MFDLKINQHDKNKGINNKMLGFAPYIPQNTSKIVVYK